MTKIDIDQFVDHDSIDEWKRGHSAALARRAQTATALEAAQVAHKAAVRASEQAAAGDGDPMEAELNLETASRALTVAGKVSDAAAAAYTKSAGRELLVKGVAHKGAYEHGITLRLAAAKAGDAARAALAAAEADYAAANALMRQACSSGLPDLHGALAESESLRSEADERAVWTARRIAADAPRHTWQPE